VVADLLVVEDAAAGGIDPAGPERFLGEAAGRMRAFEGLQGGLGVRDVAGTGSRYADR
jgi:hypothetical protein